MSAEMDKVILIRTWNKSLMYKSAGQANPNFPYVQIFILHIILYPFWSQLFQGFMESIQSTSNTNKKNINPLQ